MKAARFHRTGGPEVLQVEDIPTPQPGAGEVLVRVEAAGVNYADTVRRRGLYYPAPTVLPCIAGGELVGIVEAIGAGVDASLKGQRVYGAPNVGAYAEFAVVPQSAIFPFPKSLDTERGVALFIQGLTAALILKNSARLTQGQSVFVEGAAGGVGSLAVQLAKLYGAGKVIGGASTDAKRALVMKLGADAVVDYTKPGWSKELRKTAPDGVDLIFEMTGGAVFDESFECLATYGHIVIFGAASGEAMKPIDPIRLFMGNYAVSGFYLGAAFRNRQLVIDTLNELASLVLANKLKVEVGGVYPLARAADAHRALESRATTGKLVITPQAS